MNATRAIMRRSGSMMDGQLNRGPWKPEEDLLLKNYIEAHGVGRWNTLAHKAGLMRCGKSCRLRWMNYLRPNVKRGHISADEEDLIIRLHKLLGNRWSLIAARVPGRTDNDVKNFWNIHLSKKLNLQLPRKGTKLGPSHSKSLHPPKLEDHNISSKSMSVSADELKIPSQSSKSIGPDLDYNDTAPTLNSTSSVSRRYRAVSEKDELHKTASPLFHFQQHNCDGEGRILCDVVGLGGVQCETISNQYCNETINGTVERTLNLDSISNSFWFDSCPLPWLDGDKFYCNYGFDSTNLYDDVLQLYSMGSTSTSGI